jgi:hypothetical protein
MDASLDHGHHAAWEASALNVRPEDPRATVRQYIEETLAALVEQVCIPDGEGKPKITIKRRHATAISSYRINMSTGALESDNAETEVTYIWPGKDAYEAWRFSNHPIWCIHNNLVFLIILQA